MDTLSVTQQKTNRQTTLYLGTQIWPMAQNDDQFIAFGYKIIEVDRMFDSRSCNCKRQLPTGKSGNETCTRLNGLCQAQWTFSEIINLNQSEEFNCNCVIELTRATNAYGWAFYNRDDTKIRPNAEQRLLIYARRLEHCLRWSTSGKDRREPHFLQLGNRNQTHKVCF